MSELKQKILEWIVQVERENKNCNSNERMIRYVIKNTLFRVYELIERIEGGI